MERTALVETLVMSEKNNSIVVIKIANTDKLVMGEVQKVLNQIIILKTAAAEPVTLTFADIESVNSLTGSFVSSFLQRWLKKFAGRFSLG